MPRYYGKRILLREFSKEDLPAIRNWVNNPKIVDYLSEIFFLPHTSSGTENFLNAILDGKSHGNDFVIADLQTNQYIGQVNLLNIKTVHRVAELGVVIGDETKLGQGFGSEAINLLLHVVFNRLNFHKIELRVHDYNKRAIQCYKKCGFQEEGVFRKNFYFEGEYHDTIHMGILKHEYQKIKERGEVT